MKEDSDVYFKRMGIVVYIQILTLKIHNCSFKCGKLTPLGIPTLRKYRSMHVRLHSHWAVLVPFLGLIYLPLL